MFHTLFTSAINDRLKRYMEMSGLLGEEQAGFRAGYSTSDHIFTLHMLIEMYKAKSKRLYCAFVDYKKAFDLVDRTALWTKVVDQGIKGRVLKAVYNMYDKAKSCVSVNGSRSAEFICNIGVRQGENLSPLLFAIFLNDFNSFLSTKFTGLVDLTTDFIKFATDEEFQLYQHLFVLLYADDTILLSESAESLQCALNALEEYCDMWDLTVNIEKTKVVIFSRGVVRLYPAFLFKNEHVEVVDQYVYLGVTFYCTGNFQKTINRQISQARRALNALLWRVQVLRVPLDLTIELFEATVLPVLLYGSEVWGFSNLTQIEIFYRKFLKRILELGISTQSCFVYGESNTCDLKGLVLNRMVGFWLGIVNGKPSKISCMMYRIMLHMHTSDNFSFESQWFNCIRD